LPHASYDLWEEKFATHTYTTALTISALNMASYIATQLEDSDSAGRWANAAGKIKGNLSKLFNEKSGYYRKSLFTLPDNTVEFDDTLDISNGYGMLFLDEVDEMTDTTFSVLEDKLLNKSPSQGCPRYEYDKYFLGKNKYLGNPWVVCTLWMAQYYIKKNQTDKAVKLVDWAAAHTSGSGMLPEQVDPESGEALGVSPLIWSHADFIDTVLMLHDS
jgi:glucoamylase